MDHGPCSDWMGVIHAFLIAVNSVSLGGTAWLAYKRRNADRERKLLEDQIRFQLLHENATQKAARIDGDDLNLFRR